MEYIPSSIIRAIFSGNVEKLKDMNLSKQDLNLRLPDFEIKKFSYIDDHQLKCPKKPTPLIYAVFCEKIAIIEYLLNNSKVEVDLKANGLNALHLGAMKQNTEILKLLLTHDYFKNNAYLAIEFPGFPTNMGSTNILHAAVTNSLYNNVFFILKNDIINIDSISQSGSTSLHIAAFQKDIEMVKLLVKFNASHKIKNSNGKTVVEELRERDSEGDQLMISIIKD